MMRARKGFFAAPVGRLAGNGGARGNGFHQLDDGYAEQSRCNFKMLWRQTSAHSPWTLAKPRKRNWRNPRACLIWPKTGSPIGLRGGYDSRPPPGFSLG